MLNVLLLLSAMACPTLPYDVEINQLVKEDRMVCLYSKWWYIDENKKAWEFDVEESVE